MRWGLIEELLRREGAEGLTQAPDGLPFDALGSVYVTACASNCIHRVTPAGQVRLLYQDVENTVLCQATNCAFGGPNFDQLLVTNLGSFHISVLDLRIKGQPLRNYRELRARRPNQADS